METYTHPLTGFTTNHNELLKLYKRILNDCVSDMWYDDVVTDDMIDEWILNNTNNDETSMIMASISFERLNLTALSVISIMNEIKTYCEDNMDINPFTKYDEESICNAMVWYCGNHLNSWAYDGKLHNYVSNMKALRHSIEEAEMNAENQENIILNDCEENECCVCYENTTTKTNCGHTLCNSCVNRLQEASCPLCRGSLN